MASFTSAPIASAIPYSEVYKPATRESGNLKLPSMQSTPMEESQILRLMEQGYTRGLAQSLNRAKEAFALRIWIIDNSGSMQKTDGHRVVETRSNTDVKMVPCSRWEEIRECVNYHIKLAGAIGAPTSFRLLNDPGVTVGPQQFGVAEAPATGPQDVQTALTVMRKVRPAGCTPLTSHIYEIRQNVEAMAPQLRQSGQRVVIVIATDGLPTDPLGYGGVEHQNEFVESLRTLEGLPVWVVIRLCTDEEEVVDFYNELDVVLELSVEVLDDFCGEALEVVGENPWLNYALPLHRLREMGYHDRVFDMLDERLLTKSEVRDFCALLFGEEHFDGIPDPSVDWDAFTREIDRLLKKEDQQWSPVRRKLKPWLSLKKLNRAYDQKRGCFF